MPLPDDHRKQAAHNEAVASSLEGQGTFDWAVTAVFYTAVQEVQALIRLRGWKVVHRGRPRAPKTHGERLQVIRTHCSGVYLDFVALKDMSEAARYDAEPMTAHSVADAREILRRIRAELANL